MIGHWLERGLGQIMAPDANAPGGSSADGNNDDNSTSTRTAATAEPDDSAMGLGGLWSIVAPDPNFPPAGGSPSSPTEAAPSDVAARGATTETHAPVASSASTPVPAGDDTSEVECVHCHKMTAVSSPSPTKPLAPSSPAPTRGPSAVPPQSASKQPQPMPMGLGSPSLLSPRPSATVSEGVLTAAQFTALALSSPTALWEVVKKLFALCASASTLNDKKIARLCKMLARDPSLAQARATNMDNLVYDGATPLHACAMAGNVVGARLLLGLPMTEHGDGEGENEASDAPVVAPEVSAILPLLLDLQGRTPLHIAAEHGQVELVRILKDAMASADPNGAAPIGVDAPTDLADRTPLGWAATSRTAKARRNGKELEKELFSPGDRSVCGVPTPGLERSGCFGWIFTQPQDEAAAAASNDAEISPASTKKASASFLSAMRSPVPQPSIPALPYGHSELPGFRIEMEDATLAVYPLPRNPAGGGPASRKPPPVGMFAVFDGHGCCGTSSAFTARTLPQIIIESDLWKSYEGGSDDLAAMLSFACPIVDEKLKLAQGAISDAIDSSSLMSVCVHGSDKPPTKAGGSTGVVALVDKREIVVGNVGDSRCILVQRKAPKQSEDDSVAEQSDSNNITVTPLSFDHKPNLPDEQARIEKAGLEVISEVGNDNETIYKISKGPSDKIAVSRAFGDFDYKSNADLPAEEQAIICTPEIITHTRNPAEDLYLVLACDGIWDVMSNEEAGDFVHSSFSKLSLEKKAEGQDLASAITETLPAVGDELLIECLRRGSRDNMSVIVVSLAQLDISSSSTQIDDLADTVGRRLKLEDEV